MLDAITVTVKKIKSFMDNKSYIINELNKLSNNSISNVAKIGEGFSNNLKTKLEIVKKLHSEQLSFSESFDRFSETIIPFHIRISNTITKIETYYNGSPTDEINPVIDGFQKVGNTLINQTTSFVESEKIIRDNASVLSDILLHTIATRKLDSQFFFTFKNDLNNFLNSGILLKQKIIGDYGNSVNSFIKNTTEIMREADFLMNFYITENGSLRYGLANTISAVNNLTDMLNLFN